ncbi:unnamed protein product [Eruca vesicaria subsp. sativa]|uniref:Uncharacterized protein n=1 Tax=Eruca vesicaria subsp. sativa TaxID=29727 RepID=A0ABC8LJ80_ERUVS|nr:unnamed protein product [Eruca vesicaria subsp. sativa]
MDSFPDPILSARRRNILTRFCMGIAASLVLLTLLSLTNSVPFVSPLLKGLKTSNLNIPTQFNSSDSSPSSSSSNQVPKVVNLTNEVPDVKVTSSDAQQRTGDAGSKNSGDI